MLISHRRIESNSNYSRQLFFVSSCLLSLSFISPVRAQIIPDNSLGNESSIVTPQDALIDLIEGGAIRDDNLFHSFSEFNINDGARVDFANPEGITNILTRITGNNISEIFGTLGVDGAANLFLLNPNGIVFGENASLDVNGSFLATTAESYIFENGFAYSASNPETPPLLTIDIPVGVQFGTRAETITNLSQAVDDPTNPESVGLQTPSDASLVLIGGEIVIDGGNLTSAGKIQLGSVASNSLVNLEQDRGIVANYGQNLNFQDIYLRNLAKVEADDDIHVQGRQIVLTEGSQISSNTTDNNPASKLTVRASEKVELLGVGENEFSSVFSGLAKNNLQSDNTIDGENSVDVETPQLILRDGAKIRVSTEGQGNSGNIEIRANSIEATGISDSFSTTVIRTLSFGQGNAGNLNITAQSIVLDTGIISSLPLGDGDGGNVDITVDELSITNGGQIQSGALAGSGNAGDLRIDAKTINISGISPFRIDPSTNRPTFAEGVEASSGLLASVDNRSTGDGGNIFLETDSLNISAGGKIGSNTSNVGDAGNILIKAKSIEVRDAFVDFNDGLSGITTDVSQAAVGKGGDIDIEAESVRVLDGGQINASSLGQGNAGNITLNVRDLEIKGISEDTDFVSRVSAFSDNDFAAGSITINTNTLDVENQAEISVSNLGQGDSGTININAQDLFVNNSGQLTAEVNGGEQGNINLTTDSILLQNGNISAEATGVSTGGNITINSSDTLVVLENSRIIANAIAGNGGNINITTQGYFVALDSLVSASSEFGLDGNINIDNLNENRFLELNPLPNNLIDRSKEIIASCSAGENKFAISGLGGLPENPSQYLRGQTVWQDLRILGDNPNQITNIPEYSQKPKIIEAKVWQINQQGNVELLANLSVSERPNFGQSNHKCLH